MSADIVNRKNVRMIQGARGLRFLFEPPQTICVFRESCGQDFDRHIAIQLLIARAIDFAHSTLTQLRADFVTAKFGAGYEAHLKFVIEMTSLFAAPRDMAICLPSRDEAKLKIR